MSAQSSLVSTRPDRNVVWPFAAFIILVGGAPVAMRISYAELPPFWMGLARFGLGAVVFWALAIYRRLQVPKGRALLGVVLYGSLGVGVSFVFLAWGLVETPASLAAILLAMVPLMTVFLSAFQGVESFSARGLLGSLLAVLGIAITVGGATATDLSWPHLAAIILGTAFLAESGVILKRFPVNPPIMTNAVGMTVGAVVLGAASLIAGETWVIPALTSTWAALGYLVFFVTVLAFIFYLQVLNNWTASGTSYGFVIIPLVTFVVAAALAGEQLTVNFLLGAALVLAGVVVGALLPDKQKPAELDECKDSAGQVLPRCS